MSEGQIYWLSPHRGLPAPTGRLGSMIDHDTSGAVAAEWLTEGGSSALPQPHYLQSREAGLAAVQQAARVARYRREAQAYAKLAAGPGVSGAVAAPDFGSAQYGAGPPGSPPMVIAPHPDPAARAYGADPYSAPPPPGPGFRAEPLPTSLQPGARTPFDAPGFDLEASPLDPPDRPYRGPADRRYRKPLPPVFANRAPQPPGYRIPPRPPDRRVRVDDWAFVDDGPRPLVEQGTPAYPIALRGGGDFAAQALGLPPRHGTPGANPTDQGAGGTDTFRTRQARRDWLASGLGSS